MNGARPPRVAACLMRLSLGDDDADAVLGDLAEDFAAMAAANGPAAARRWFWRQTATSLLPNLRRKTRCVMEALVQDLRYGWRMIVRRPVLTTVAIVSLVTGITLPAIVFSLLNAVVFRPLPVEAPDELVVVHEVRTTGINHNLPYPDFIDYRNAQRSFVDLAAYSARDLTVKVGGESRFVAGELVSGRFFPLLGIPLRAGRGITDDDDRSGGEFVAVVSEALWRDLTGRDVSEGFTPQTINVNAQEFAVIGVLAAPFRGMQVGRDARIWLPLHAQPILEGPGGRNSVTRRTASWLTVIGRLARGITREAATADLNHVEAALAPTVKRPQPKTLTLAPGRQGDSSLPRTVSSPLTILLGAGVLVLFVAAANVAGLLLARANERVREMAVRAALGARGTRLARLVITEIMILGAIGTVLALVASHWLATLVVPFMSTFGEAVVLDTPTDLRVVAFVAGLAVLMTLLAALAPTAGALRALSPEAFSEGGRTASETPNAGRVRRSLVVVQFALSLSLVVACLLSARTVYNLRTLPTGFDIDHIALFAIDPEAAQYDLVRARGYMTSVIERVSALPGVRAAGFARVLPLGFGGSRMTVIVPGYQPAHDEDMELNYNVAGPTYFDAMGIRLLAGRFFDERDTRDRPQVAVVNETMAARYWPRGNAVGQRVRFEEKGPDVEIIGIAQDVKYRMLREDAAASFYIPYAQTSARDGVLHVRATGDPGALLASVRHALTGADANVPVTMTRTLQDQAALNLSDERLAMLIALTLAGAGLLLAAVGLYGSMSYAVGQRVREFGVRMAVGATMPDIRRLILRQGLTLCLLGTALGSLIALAFGRAIEHRLFGVTARDPLTLVAAAVILCAVGLFACWVPARRAMRVDPAAALRT